eukprot:UN07703
MEKSLFSKLQPERHVVMSKFVQALHKLYQRLHFTYLEINPIVYHPETSSISILDLAAKVDEAAAYDAGKYWNSTSTGQL